MIIFISSLYAIIVLLLWCAVDAEHEIIALRREANRLAACPRDRLGRFMRR